MTTKNDVSEAVIADWADEWLTGCPRQAGFYFCVGQATGGEVDIAYVSPSPYYCDRGVMQVFLHHHMVEKKEILLPPTAAEKLFYRPAKIEVPEPVLRLAMN